MMIRRPRIELDRGDTIGGTAPLILMDQISFTDKRRRFLHRDDRKRTSSTVWALVWVSAIVGTAAFAAWRIGLPMGGVVERVAGLFQVRRTVLALVLIAAGLAACSDRVGVKGRGGNKGSPQWGVQIKLPPPE